MIRARCFRAGQHPAASCESRAFERATGIGKRQILKQQSRRNVCAYFPQGFATHGKEAVTVLGIGFKLQFRAPLY